MVVQRGAIVASKANVNTLPIGDTTVPQNFNTQEPNLGVTDMMVPGNTLHQHRMQTHMDEHVLTCVQKVKELITTGVITTVTIGIIVDTSHLIIMLSIAMSLEKDKRLVLVIRDSAKCVLLLTEAITWK